MSPREIAVVSTAAVVGIAAMLGGAFFPGPRVVVGALLALTLGGALATTRGRLEGEEWAWVAFCASGVVSGLAAASAPLAAREAVTVWLIAGALWIVARRATTRASTAGGVVLGVSAVFLAIGVVLEAGGVGQVRVAGLLENPNITASLLVVAIPTLLGVELSRRWVAVAAAVIAVGLLMTGSRAGLLALLAAVAVLVPRGWPRTLGLVGGGAGVAVVVIWRFASQPDVLAWFRPAIWLAVLRIWMARPFFGIGPGGLVDAAGVERLLHADHVGQRQFLIAYAESSPLAVLVQTGLVGMAIVTLGLLAWWRGVRGRGGLSRPMTATLASMVVMGAFHDLLTVDIVLWWWALAFGLLEARSSRSSSQDEVRSKSGPSRLVIALVFAFAVLWGMVQPAWARWLWRSEGPRAELVARATRAEPWFDAPLEWRSRELLRKPMWSWRTAAEAIALSERAITVHPGAARLWSVHGMTQARTVTEFGQWSDSVAGARAAFSRAVELEPHQPWTWLEWARLERNLGHSETAINLVQRALEEEPHTIRARLFLARLHLDRGDLVAAREAYGGALESARLRTRRGLNSYERELLTAPAWQFREIAEALQ